MKLVDRARAFLLRIGIIYDEPSLLVLDDSVVNAMNAGASLVVDFHHPPVLLRPTSSTPQPINVPAPTGTQ